MSFPNRGEGGGGPHLGKIPTFSRFFFWERPLLQCKTNWIWHFYNHRQKSKKVFERGGVTMERVQCLVKGGVGGALETWRKYFNGIPEPCWAGPSQPQERDPSYLDQIPKTSLKQLQCSVVLGAVQGIIWEECDHSGQSWAAISGLATLTPGGAETWATLWIKQDPGKNGVQ